MTAWLGARFLADLGGIAELGGVRREGQSLLPETTARLWELMQSP